LPADVLPTTEEAINIYQEAAPLANFREERVFGRDYVPIHFRAQRDANFNAIIQAIGVEVILRALVRKHFKPFVMAFKRMLTRQLELIPPDFY